MKSDLVESADFRNGSLSIALFFGSTEIKEPKEPKRSQRSTSKNGISLAP